MTLSKVSGVSPSYLIDFLMKSVFGLDRQYFTGRKSTTVDGVLSDITRFLIFCFFGFFPTGAWNLPFCFFRTPDSLFRLWLLFPSLIAWKFGKDISAGLRANARTAARGAKKE